MKRIVVLFVLSLTAAACGGGSDSLTGPSPVSPAPVVISRTFDGWDGRPIEATLTGGSFNASGYLPRVQTAAASVFLWPADQAYTDALVYTQYSPNHLLARWTRGFTIQGSSADVAAIAAQASAATGLSITPSDVGEVTVSVDPTDKALLDIPEAAAVTYRTFAGSVTTSCKIVFREANYHDGSYTFRGFLLHEVGHCLGLGHSIVSSDSMGSGVATQYSPAELVTLRMMYAHRAPGNASPDRESVSVSSASTTTIVVP